MNFKVMNIQFTLAANFRFNTKFSNNTDTDYQKTNDLLVLVNLHNVYNND